MIIDLICLLVGFLLGIYMTKWSKPLIKSPGFLKRDVERKATIINTTDAVEDLLKKIEHEQE